MRDDLKRKIAVAAERLRAFEPADGRGYHLAFSGGKDSIALKRLAELAGVKFDAHYNVTTIDPPELTGFIRSEHPDVVWDWPRGGGIAQICARKRMLPTRLMRFCCNELKERGGEGRTVLTGVRWAESPRRAERAQMVRPCVRGGKVTVNPIIDWTDEDVWEFIRAAEIPYCGLYDEGFARLGCVGCPLAGPVGMAREFTRWPGYLRMYYHIAGRILPEIIARRVGAGKPVLVRTAREFIMWWVRDQTRDQRHGSVIARLLDSMGLK
jgi:phosphoadenosine phosphosulfate reductase